MTLKFDASTILTLLATLATSGLLGSCTTGCAPQTTELERAWTTINQEVIGPAVTKAMEETSTRTSTLQASAQANNPGYEVEVLALFGTGIHAKTVVRLVGVSGQISGHAQADAGQPGVVPPPVIRGASDAGKTNIPAMQPAKLEDPTGVS
jgi:hypothetical protein